MGIGQRRQDDSENVSCTLLEGQKDNKNGGWREKLQEPGRQMCDKHE